MKLLICVVVFLQVCSQQLLADPIPKLKSLGHCPSKPTTTPTPTPKPCKELEEGDLTITVDNIAELYFDGQDVTHNLSHANNWTYADTIKVPALVQVIGVKGVDLHVVAGILASGAHSTTDDSWRCTNETHDSWNLPSYDDSHWPKATVIGKHNTPGDLWGIIAGISLDAKWIWTPNHQYGPDSDKTVYCRKKRTCTPVHPATVAPTTPLPPTVAPTTPLPPTESSGPCITSCRGRPNGDYQSCKGCTVYATCSNGLLYDQRPCAYAGEGKYLYWDDNKKRCEWESDTCKY